MRLAIAPAQTQIIYVPRAAQGARQMSVRSTITAQFQQVAREQDRTLAPLSDDLRLVQSGLDSLSFAIIVARLEDSLGIDPFNAADAVEFPVTFGDFVRLYEDFGK
jgi:acyl carrier protein